MVRPPVVGTNASLAEFSHLADKLVGDGRLCLDAGAAIVPQVAWAEMHGRNYRIALSHDTKSSITTGRC